jgi:hypothetical protein
MTSSKSQQQSPNEKEKEKTPLPYDEPISAELLLHGNTMTENILDQLRKKNDTALWDNRSIGKHCSGLRERSVVNNRQRLNYMK